MMSFCKRALALAVCAGGLLHVAVARPVEFLVTGFGAEQTQPVPVTLDWNERRFGARPSAEYDHAIARMACLLAKEAYTDSAVGKGGLYDAYRRLGVRDEDMEFHYDVNYSDPLWGRDQCAFSFASKEIDSAAGRRQLLFVVVRGTPTGADEWISNLNLSDRTKTESPVHEGFSLAEQRVHSAFISYLLRHKIEPEQAFVLITGHSRGAAVSNLLAADFVYDNLFSIDNVYAYTFAAPNVVTGTAPLNSAYNFIWNIVNAEDIVPTLPIRRNKWDYRKFGHTRTLVNAWNVGAERYAQLLPRMNAYFVPLVGREYCPFYLGAFIPVQVADILSTLNEDVRAFYAPVTGLHDRGTAYFARHYLTGTDMGTDADAGTDVVTDAGSDSGGQRVQAELFRSWVNARSGGLYDYATVAFEDMHTVDTYLSWLLALEESEAFSDKGYSQVVLRGNEDSVVLDAQGQVLVRISDGRVLYGTAKLPIGTRQILGNKVVIGFPAEQEFSLVISNESLAPTPTTVQVERYSAEGQLVAAGEVQKLYPCMGSTYQVLLGCTERENCTPSVEWLVGTDALTLSRALGLVPPAHLTLRPELGIDTNATVTVGARAGTEHFFGTLLAGLPLPNMGTVWVLAPGLGTQQNIIASAYMDAEAFAKLVWTHPGDGWNVAMVPAVRISCAVQPIHRVQCFVAGELAFYIDGWNDGAFVADVWHQTMPLWGNGTVRIAPAVQVGVRF